MKGVFRRSSICKQRKEKIVSFLEEYVKCFIYLMYFLALLRIIPFYLICDFCLHISCCVVKYRLRRIKIAVFVLFERRLAYLVSLFRKFVCRLDRLNCVIRVIEAC